MAARPVPASKLSSVARKKKLLEDNGVTPPLPARYETAQGGFKLRVRAADPLTKDWRANLKAAEPDSVPPLEHEQPLSPNAYDLPKDVLKRTPDEPLLSKQAAPE